MARRGVADLTMHEVAAAAGVGVGTVYRRFESLAGLVGAIMDERERQLQDGMLHGPPPLGPGAPAADRVRAFLHAYLDVLDTYGELLAAAHRRDPDRQFQGAYVVHHTHLATLLAELYPRRDADYLASALLAPLSADQFVHQRRRGVTIRRMRKGLDDLLQGIGR